MTSNTRNALISAIAVIAGWLVGNVFDGFGSDAVRFAGVAVAVAAFLAGAYFVGRALRAGWLSRRRGSSS